MDEADDLACQYGVIVLRLSLYLPDLAALEGVVTILKQWSAAESAQYRLAGAVMPH